MTRRVIVRKFDPIRPVYAAKKFPANGKQYEIGEELAWRALEIPKRRIRQMYDAGLLAHGDEKPRHEMVRERNMNSASTVPQDEPITDVESAHDDGAFPRHAGGPWYELSNGERVKGKKKAQEAEGRL